MPQTYTNGIVTFYEDAGAGEPVALIHGHSLDGRMWAYQVPALVEAGFRAVRHDVRGHGRTEIPPDGYTWENYARDLAELLDHLNIERAHVVGLSMGGGISMQFALDYPERVLSLTLVDSALPGFGYSDAISNTIQALRDAVAAEGVWPAFQRLWLSHPLFDGVRTKPEAYALAEEMVHGFQAPEYVRRGEESTEPETAPAPQVVDRLGEIAVRTLVVVGENDVDDFRFIAEILAATIPGARQVILPGCGHMVPMEDPHAFNGLLLDFLAGPCNPSQPV